MPGEGAASTLRDCDVALIGGGPAGSIRAWRRWRDNIRDADAANAGA